MKPCDIEVQRLKSQQLKTVCTQSQWAHYLPVARRAAPPEIWAAVVAEVPSLEAMAEMAA